MLYKMVHSVFYMPNDMNLITIVEKWFIIASFTK